MGAEKKTLSGEASRSWTDMGASFVAAVLADNERLRGDVLVLEKRLADQKMEAFRKNNDLMCDVYELVGKLGGDVKFERRRLSQDSRRLCVEYDDYGAAVRYVLAPDSDVLTFGENVFPPRNMVEA